MDKKIIDVAETCRRIKKLIEENKYTPREVQFKLGLESVQTVYKWYSSNNKTIPYAGWRIRRLKSTGK